MTRQVLREGRSTGYGPCDFCRRRGRLTRPEAGSDCRSASCDECDRVNLVEFETGNEMARFCRSLAAEAMQSGRRPWTRAARRDGRDFHTAPTGLRALRFGGREGHGRHHG